MKCPSCKSTSIVIPQSFMFAVYSVKPITCLDCDVQFEASLYTRLGIWIFLSSIFLFSIYSDDLLSFFEIETLQVMMLSLIGFLFLSVVFGVMLEFFHSWQYVIWRGSNTKRKIINYGCELSFYVYSCYFIFQLFG